MTDQAEAQEQENESEQEEVPQETKDEAEAREMGWKPEAEWTGNKDGWMPADEFKARNERLKDRGGNILKAENAKLAAQLRDVKQVVDDLKGHMSRAEEGAYKRAYTEIKDKQRRAVADGDSEAFEAAEVEAETLKNDAEKAKAKTATKAEADTPNPDDDPEFVDWLGDNPWYDPKDDAVDLELRAFANQVAPEAAAMGLKGKALYQRVTKEVKKKFPDRFGNAKRRNAAAVEGAGTGGGGGQKKGYSDLPADAKKACDNLVREKLYDRPNQNIKLSDKQARERYASDYFGEE